MRVKGKGKTPYIVSLRDTIKGIFDSYQVIKPDLLYEILLPETVKEAFHGSFASADPPMVNEKIIRTHIEEGEDYLDPILKKIPLGATGQGYCIYFIKNFFENSVVEMKEIGNITNSVVTEGNNNQTNADVAGGDQKKIDSPSTITVNEVIFNFHKCTVSLQGDLNSLARSLRAANQDCDEDTEELLLAAEELEEVQKQIPPDTAAELPVEVKTTIQKKGLLNRLKYICDELNDENSALYKKVSKVKYCVKIAQNIGKKYNEIAQYIGLPQVPKPFLGKAIG